MSKIDTNTKILEDGLRYKSKVAGSPFKCTSYMGTNTTMSCLMCGKHRERSFLAARKIAGKNQLCCAPSCKAVDEAIASGATKIITKT